MLKSDGEAEKVATLSAEAATIKKEQTTLRTELGTHKIRVAEPDPVTYKKKFGSIKVHGSGTGYRIYLDLGNLNLN